MNVAQVGGSIDGGGKLLLTAEEDKVVVVRWAWASVYQLLGQLGLAFMVLLVRGNFWEEAGTALELS